MNAIYRHKHLICRKDKEKSNGHKGVTIWLTGLSGSGKSTIANHLEKKLFDRGYNTILLDGDNIRHGLNCDLGFSKADRAENIRRLYELAKLLTDNGLITITAFISPFRKDRDKARKAMGKGDFIEVFLDCAISTCRQRDPKGLYRKAVKGRIGDFTGISHPYEKPLKPEIELNTSEISAAECSDRIFGYLKKKGYIK